MSLNQAQKCHSEKRERTPGPLPTIGWDERRNEKAIDWGPVHRCFSEEGSSGLLASRPREA
jgi:hypothetical protein